MRPTSRSGPDLAESWFCGRETSFPLDVDRVFECLAHRRRREVLCLLDEEPEWTLDRMVVRLSAGASARGGGPEWAVESDLYHNHLPRLGAVGLISTPDAYRIVRRGEHFPIVRELLEAVAAAFA